MSGPVALVGDREDLSAAYIAWLVEERGGEVLWCDESELGISWTFTIDEGERRARLVVGDRVIPLEDVPGIFVRLNPDPGVPRDFGLGDDGHAVLVRERRYAIHALLSRSPGVVMNRPSAGRGNGSKPFQMTQLAKLGFEIPEWTATNDALTARHFLERHGPCVYKACSGTRSRVRIAGAQLLDSLSATTTPVVLQRAIAGHDVRVHVIGDEVAGTSVECDSVDYRFDEAEVSYRTVDVPEALGRRCVEVAAFLGLLLAGYDFRVDGTGRWWCLEVNPVPTFLPYEAGAGHPIGDDIVDLLAPSISKGTGRSCLAPLAEPA